MAKIMISHFNSVTFELWYGDSYCDSFDSGKSAIRRAKETFRNNPEMTGCYTVWADASEIRFVVATIENKEA